MSIVTVLDMHEQAGWCVVVFFPPSVIIGYQLQFVVIRHTTHVKYTNELKLCYIYNG